MRTMLQERHRPAFAVLTPEQMDLVWGRVVTSWPADMRKFLGSPPSTPGELFETCRDAGLDHARVVLSLAMESNPLGRGTLEALVGRPIAPWAASVEAAQMIHHVNVNGDERPKKVAAPRSAPDTRVVVEVLEPNPHREGTAMWKAYKKWRVGASIVELSQTGMPARSIRRDIRHGYIKVELVK